MTKLPIKVTCALVFGLFLSSAKSPAQRNLPNVELIVGTIPSQPLPVKADQGAKLHTLGFTSELIANLSGVIPGETKSVDLELFVYDDSHVIGGEGWTVSNPTSSIMKVTTLGLEPGDKALLVISSVVNKNNHVFRTSQKEIAANLLHVMRGEAPTSLDVLPWQAATSAAPAGLNQGSAIPAFAGCPANLASAQLACQTTGLHSFSCNPTTGEYSFTCN